MVQVLLLLTVCCTVLGESGAQAGIPTLHLLTMVPLAEKGDELITAARLAVHKINTRDDILPGYKLEIVQANTETRNQSLVTEALGNFMRHVTDGDLNIVGVVGLVCSTVTQAVSPLAGRPEIDLLQISAGATSPVFAREKDYPRLYRMIPSSAIYNDAVLALMTEFQWGNISVVKDTTLIQHTTTADDFVEKVKLQSAFDLVLLGDVTPTFSISPIQNLLQKAARVIYASVTVSEARGLVCDSYWRGRHWPDFVWLFHDLSFEELMQSTESCSNDTMLRALEGVFLLQYRLQPNSSTTLVSGQTYSEYHMELQKHIVGAKENRDANALHDSIWAFALALNKSRSELETYTSQLDKSIVTTLVERNLRSVHFSGALGDIAFNDEREVVKMVDISHVREGKLVYVGHYNPLTQNVTVQLPLDRIPKDYFDTNVVVFTGLTITTFLAVIILCIFTTVVLVFVIYYWNKPSIKATSPFLSLLILAGCYMLYIGCFIAGVRESIDFQYFGPLCQAQLWFCMTGLELIYSALFMRLLRIYRIFFFIFKKPGKLWSDQSMLALTFIPVSVVIFLLTLWSAVDPIVTRYSQPRFEPMGNPPHYIVGVFCESHALIVWLIVILYGVNGVTIVGVGVLAMLTRKVHLECFKDTKHVNMFVFSTIISVCIWLPYLLCFSYIVPLPIAGYLFSVLSYLVIPFLCKVFLFVPKIWSAKHEKRRSKRQLSKTSISLARQNSYLLSPRTPLPLKSSPTPSNTPSSTTNRHGHLERTNTIVTFVSCL